MPRSERSPDPTGDDPIGWFAWELRLLRERAGDPDYGVLAVAAGFSETILAEAAGGRSLPSLQVLRAYVRACGGDVGEWERRWHEASAALTDPGDVASPYVGLREFRVEDADRFFGREDMTAELVDRVTRHRIVVVSGESGSGKSSLLRAGLQARWTGGRCVVVTPGGEPTATVTAALVGLAGAGDVLVIDRFEDVLTRCDVAERDRCVALVVAASSRVRVVLGVGSDHREQCLRLAGPVDELPVVAMTAEQLTAVITRPAAMVGATVRPELVAALESDCAGRPTVLPLLSHALRETWRRRDGMTMTLAAYEAAGGVANALPWTAEWAYVRCDDAQRELMRTLFLRLTAEYPTRVEPGELDGENPDLWAVLDQLTWAGLITVDGHIEIGHEALIHAWPRLGEWLAEDGAGRRMSRARAGRRGMVLLVALVGVLVVLTGTLTALNRGEQRSVARQQGSGDAQRVLAQAEDLADIEPATAEQLALAAYRLDPTEATASGVLDLLAGERVRTSGVPGGALAVNPTGTLMVVQPNGGHVLGLWQIEFGDVRPVGVLGSVRTDPPYSATFSADGRLLLIGGADAATLWDVTQPADPVLLSTLPGAGGDAAFGGDRSLVTGDTVWDITDPAQPTVLDTLPDTAAAALNGDGTVLARIAGGRLQLWDLSTPHRPRLASARPLAGKPFATPAWHGSTLAVVTGATTWLWRVTDSARPTLLATLRSPAVRVNGLTFSADGLDLATTSVEGPVETWDISTPTAPVRTLSTNGLPGQAVQAAFTATGRRLITGTAPNGVTSGLVSWHYVPPAALVVGTLPTAYGSAFSSDGATLATVGATASGDPATNLWDVRRPWAPRPVAVLDADAGTVTTTRHPVPYSGQSLFPYNGLDPLPESFSRSRDLLVTTGAHVLRLWDVTDDRRPRPLAALPKGRQSGQLSPNGRLLLDDGRLWDVTDTAHPRPVGGVAVPADARFSPDGTRLVSADDGGVVLYDIHGSTPVVTARIHVPSVAAAFSPDGRTLIIVAPSGPIMLWSVADHTWLSTLPGTAQPAGFSTDGHLLAARAGHDGVIRLWNMTDPRNPVPNVAIGTGFPVQFSPNGHTLAVLATDGSLQLRETDVYDAIATICATTPTLSRSTWQRYLSDHAYQPPCAGMPSG